MTIKNTILALSLVISSGAQAQFKLPSFDIGLKAGYLFIEDYRGQNNGQSEPRYESLSLQGELNVHLSQHIAVGYFYQRNALFSNYWDKEGSSETDLEARHLITGLSLRVSTGRAPKFRPYMTLKYFKLQGVVDHSTFKLATNATGASAGIGLMLRLGHNLYVTVIEGQMCNIMKSGEVLFKENTLFPQIHTGINYNFSKRK